MTYGDIKYCLAKEMAPARIDIRLKYPENHSVSLVKNEDFSRGRVLSSLLLVYMAVRPGAAVGVAKGERVGSGRLWRESKHAELGNN